MNEPTPYERNPEPVVAMQLCSLPDVWKIAEFIEAKRVELNDRQTEAVYTLKDGGAFTVLTNSWVVKTLSVANPKVEVYLNEAFKRNFRLPEGTNDNKGNGQS